MPYVENDGIKIYYETEGEGPPLVMAHGGSDSLEMWKRFNYTDYLKANNQLVLFDFRGNGKSDKPTDVSDYGPVMAEDIVKILDALEIPKANFFGYSLGAQAGFHLAIHHPDRFSSFVLGGVSPYTWPDEMVTAVNVVIEGFRLKMSDPDAYIEQMEELLEKTFSPEERDEMLSGNTESDIAVMTSLLEWPPATDEELSAIDVPCLIYCGEDDPFITGATKAVSLMPRVRFLPMPGFNHVSAFVESTVVLPYIAAFLSVADKI